MLKLKAEERYRMLCQVRSVPVNEHTLQSFALSLFDSVRFHLLEQAAAEKDAEGCYLLGHAYDYGHGVEHNIEKAGEALKLAARLGHPDAFYQLGVFYECHPEWRKSRKESCHLRKIANCFFAKSAKLRELEYHRIVAVAEKASGEEAKKWFTLACEYNEEYPKWRLFKIMKQENDPEAKAFGMELKEDGEALLREGKKYYYGGGANIRDFEAAFALFEKAAAAGNILAYPYLAMCYEKGQGVEQNETIAERLRHGSLTRIDSLAEKIDCTMCGKQFTRWDYLMDNNRFDIHVGYGSRHDTEHIRCNFCTDCYDRLLDMILPMCKLNPIVD